MIKTMIKTNHLSKDYGQGRGIFDLNLEITKGEVFGIVGVNGAGKTTLLRLLMGFLKPSQGTASINGQDCWKDAAQLKKIIGYVPGEIAFPDTKSGQTFLKMQLGLLKQKSQDNVRVNELIQKLKIDTTANIKRMSKGMKQKVALVCAFMTDADVLLLDEPTTGLDPVMREVFIELVLDAKKRGITVIMSSHMFNELEPTCDRIAFLKGGKIINMIDQDERQRLIQYQKVQVKFEALEDFNLMKDVGFEVASQDDKTKTISFISHQDQTVDIINHMKEVTILQLDITPYGLDQYFSNELSETA